ncbi:MAG: hypothetical protein ACI9CE_003117 [Flavobacterium sp.]|jgi:uncharacterized protein YfkK (UPF0435 family)
MVKRRITLSSQEMTDITKETSSLKIQLDLSNQRVDELENGLVVINKFINKKTKPKDVEKLCDAVQKLVDKAINPPVKAREATALSH